MKDYFQKENVPKKEFIEELSLLIVKNNFTNLICGKYLTKTFGSTFLSKINFPFHETIFTRNLDIAKQKVCKNLKHVFIKFTQANLQKCITWPKKFGKGR